MIYRIFGITIFPITLFLSSCAHYYTQQDYPIEGNYEEFINSEIKNHIISVKLISDSIFIVENVNISDKRDSIIFTEINYNTGVKKLPTEQV
ncbi:MAG: hypothetical protein Q7S39_09635 [Ignavibacteria bacterium]|nr:hypothetical protein [Ignavibacteria bacterium]